MDGNFDHKDLVLLSYVKTGNHLRGPNLFIKHYFLPAENILVISSLQMSSICAVNEERDLITSPKENCGLVVKLGKSVH